MARNIGSPAATKNSKMPAAVTAAIKAIRFFSAGDRSEVAEINTGTVPIGSMTAHIITNLLKESCSVSNVCLTCGIQNAELARLNFGFYTICIAASALDSLVSFSPRLLRVEMPRIDLGS